MKEIKIKKTMIPERILKKWQNVVNIIADLLSAPSSIITRVLPPEIEVVSSALVSENPYKSGDKVLMASHYCERVVTTNQKLEVNYAPENPEWAKAPEIKYGMLAYMGLPVCWPGGEMFGTICVLDNKKNEFGDRYEKVLSEFRDLIETQLSLIETNEKLNQTLNEVKKLRGLLPICSFCKKVRDDQGYWNMLESYIEEHSDTQFSHSICPDCAKKHYPEYDLKNNSKS